MTVIMGTCGIVDDGYNGQIGVVKNAGKLKFSVNYGNDGNFSEHFASIFKMATVIRANRVAVSFVEP